MINKNNYLFSKNIIYNSGIAIFLFISANSIFNSISFALGADGFSSTFLMPPFDLFGDYFKAIFSFIQGEKIEIHGPKHLVQLLNTYIAHNPYSSIDSITKIRLNLHGMPLATSFALINLKLMTWINPLHLFLVILIALLAFTYLLLKNIDLSRNERFILLFCFVFSYPSLFLIVRGHFYSAFTTLALLAFILLLCQKQHLYALLFLAIAINFRPNAVIFIFIFLFCSSLNEVRKIIIYLLYFCLVAVSVFILSLYFANFMYKEYSLLNFVTAVKMYHTSYVSGNNGLAFGSSMLGAIKILGGSAKYAEPLIFLTTVLLLSAGIHLLRMKKISVVIFIYLICALYQLVTSTFADYYLGIFFAPIIYQVIASKNESIFFKCSGSVSFYAPYWACILLLVPKSYIFVGDTSLQVVLNPLVTVITVTYIMYSAVFCDKTATN
jgi:hypothetical protein